MQEEEDLRIKYCKNILMYKSLKIIIVIQFFCLSCESQNENFDKFFYKFCNEEEFQISRVKFPLKHLYLSDENFDKDSTLIQKNSYSYDKLLYNLLEYTDSYPVFYDNFNSKLSDTDERLFRWKGFTGNDERFYFKRVRGKWFLVKTASFGT
ncbi:MAG: DUF4348 domain-containing protein [Bacteroidota bacterium]